MENPQQQPDTTPATPDGDDNSDPHTELVTVTWEGKSWNVPKDRGKWDMNVQFEFEEGNTGRGLLLLLGGADNLYKTRAEIYEICKTQADFRAFEKHVGEVLNKECIN